MFQEIDEYLVVRLWISYAATRNHDQCKNTSIPEKRNRRIEPLRIFIVFKIYSTTRRG